MPTGKVTKETIDALVPGPRDAFLWDSKLSGFGVKVTPAGNRVFLYQYRMGGRASKTRRYTIGSLGTWTPKQARDEATRLSQLVDQGTDPLTNKKNRQRVASNSGFDAIADRFLADEVTSNWKRSYDDVARILRKHVRPILKSKPLPDIRKADIIDVLDSIPPHQKALRRKTYAILSRLFSWAVGKDILERSPLAAVEVPVAPAARDRALKDWELRLAWIAAGEIGYPFGPLYRILLATGQRREEVSGLNWKELHRDTAEWHLPGTRAKNQTSNIVHLSPAAIAEIDRMAGGEKWPRRGLVFTTTGETPVSGYSRAKARLDSAMLKAGRKEIEEAGDDPAELELERWTVHDLRRTLATGLQRLGVRFEVTEAILNHVSGSKSGVAGVYQRHDWRDEKRDALNAWAAHVEHIVNGSDYTNIIALAARRA